MVHQASLANITQVADHTINKNPGDTLTLVVGFNYQGPGNWQDNFYVNLYQYTLGVINQVNNWQQLFPVTVTDPALNTPVAKEVTLNYVIPSGRTGGFGVMVYLVNDEGAGVIYLDVTAHTGCVIIGSNASVISNLTIASYS